ncbi:phenylacetate--CoA ligase family protein [Geobacter benzoatilyticus]|uniref:Phenylacetate--CoA ligase family protein n=1 Tax=Geobacter benzoatilyticus TaxID=2815309 RepID=A0ABX7Q0W9_9BACT|nr:phenylacetate--CoA ligase family protein [Geobacter benzoatilyticus]QSV45044.1 phenylacetate--CoA ligase family protein [Geobacter benzoatilyticus]
MSLSGSFIRTVIVPLWAMKEGTPYLRHLKGLDGSKKRPLAQVQADQLQRLKKLLGHAYDNTPFYRRQFDSTAVKPSDISTLDDLRKLPLLTKDDIRANGDDMIARNIPRDQLVAKKTSGSTGVSVELFVDEASAQWKRAVTVSYDRWAGWDIGERVGAIWGNPECYQNWRAHLRNSLLTRHIPLDTLKMGPDTMRAYYDTLLKKKPVILFGHAHSLYLFARFLEEKELSGIHPRGIISTCMVLHDFERQTIERVFGCRVTNRYGCEEVSLIACECPEGNFHLNCDTLIVEFIRDGKPVAPGEPGAIVVTDLTNYGMPFIRYKVGDVGIPSAKTSCPCGCTYPIMDSLEGRVADYVVTPDGNYISGISLTENFAMHLPGVKQMQIVQEELDHLTFRIVKGESFSEQTVADIKRLAYERFGARVRFDIEYVDSIQSESSGKYRFCISKLQNPFS